ncbi:MFS transporter [Actinoallomurus spadix]|uniref:MFS transporter n=1 Tax=Actinoallomurus spadix TaxID=79912 RepID=A0ABP3H4Y9_9ACTN|nr:MFS transporter [Actinoallomurus spadix]MCO5988796.1 MFS transporter [Actinoallomurus spadix]
MTVDRAEGGTTGLGTRDRMTVPLTFLFAVSGGAAVGDLYYAQPLLDLIAHDLRVGEGTAGSLVTAAQVGYAAGIVFIVPLGDLRDRRRLIPVMMLLCAVALTLCALAPNILALTLAMAAVGVTTVSGQILVPFAGDLAAPARRGRVVGTVVSGLITGILAARILSGLVAGVAGWRAVFALAAGSIVLLAAALYRMTPAVPPRTTTTYRALLRSVGSLVRREPAVRVIMVSGALGFGTFTMFWTALTFLLSSAPYDYSPTVIGSFGIAGLLGSVAAQSAGRLHDSGRSRTTAGLSWPLAIASWGIAGLGSHSLPWLIAGIVALDVATQARNILNQAQIFTIAPEARSRLNTAYITGNFIGGAVGSVLASALWSAGGWPAVVIAGAAASFFGFLHWAATRRHLTHEGNER